MNITEDSQGSELLQLDTNGSLRSVQLHMEQSPEGHLLTVHGGGDSGERVEGQVMNSNSDTDRSSSFSSDRPVITNVSPLYHEAQQHAAAMKVMDVDGGVMMMDGGATGLSGISTTPGGFTTTTATAHTATPISVVSSTPLGMGSTPAQRSYGTTTNNAYQGPVVTHGGYNAATIMQGQQTFFPTMQTNFPQKYQQKTGYAQAEQQTVLPYGPSSMSTKQSQTAIKYAPATSATTTSGFMYAQPTQSSISTKTGMLTTGTSLTAGMSLNQGMYFSTNPETPLSTNLLSSELYTSRLHKTGSRTGRWVTNLEGYEVEGKLETGDLRVVGERVVEFQVKLAKKVIREEQWEKIIVVPETQIKEDIIEDVQVVREKIVEYTKSQKERVVEVPEIQYVERVVEVPERVVQERLVHVPKIEVHERVIEVPRYVDQERIVEVAEIEYKEVLIEKFVEVPEYREEVVVREVPVPQYVDKPVPEYVDTPQKVLVERNIPVPVAAETIWKMYLPKLKPRFTTERIPLYVPRFIEVPVPIELLTNARELEARQLAERVSLIAQQSAISLCEVENVAAAIKSANFQANIENADFFDGIQRGWKEKSLLVKKGDMYKRAPSYKGDMYKRAPSYKGDMYKR
eukprot:Lankesteria_metandrocarpae@DN4417_c1_g1_i1.p1